MLRLSFLFELSGIWSENWSLAMRPNCEEWEDHFCLIINILSQFTFHISSPAILSRISHHMWGDSMGTERQNAIFEWKKIHPTSTICLDFLKEILCESNKFWIFPQFRRFRSLRLMQHLPLFLASDSSTRCMPDSHGIERDGMKESKKRDFFGLHCECGRGTRMVNKLTLAVAIKGSTSVERLFSSTLHPRESTSDTLTKNLLKYKFLS